jgi:hypothetical protein
MVIERRVGSPVTLNCWVPRTLDLAQISAAVMKSDSSGRWQEILTALQQAREVSDLEVRKPLSREALAFRMEMIGADSLAPMLGNPDQGASLEMGCDPWEELRAASQLRANSTGLARVDSSRRAYSSTCVCFEWTFLAWFSNGSWHLQITFYFCVGGTGDDYAGMINGGFWQFPCGGAQPDARDYIIGTYKDSEYFVPSPTAYSDYEWKPACSDFSQTNSSYYFSHDELSDDGNGTTWAVLRASLLAAASTGSGADAWRTEYGDERTVSSGYRAPQHNKDVGGALGSRHMFGDALDLYNSSCNGDPGCQENSTTLAEWIEMYDAAGRANANFRENRDSSMGSPPYSGIKHVHADWRPPPNQ